MAANYTQSFLIHRHGARYPLKKPEHNATWPNENKFWKCHIGKLTPFGVVQMCNLGQFFRHRYPWVNTNNLTVFSTHRSRALESAWSFILGLLPNTPIKFEPMKSYRSCEGEVCCGKDVCCIHYYHKGDDLIFGQADPSMAYKINVNESGFLKSLLDSPEIIALIDRLSRNGHFRIRRDSITTIAKLKDIHAQLGIDSQLQIPPEGSLIGKYGLTPIELDLIRKIGNEVICRRLVPSTDLISDRAYNEDQGKGIINTIRESMIQWDRNHNEFQVFSCHDTNLIAIMSLLGIKIDCPNFAGYILIERTFNTEGDLVSFYFCEEPFDTSISFSPKIWTPLDQRHNFLDWKDLSSGIFTTSDFISLFHVEHLK
jgi:hypothetical protein